MFDYKQMLQNINITRYMLSRYMVKYKNKLYLSQ